MYWNETCALINQVKGDSSTFCIRNCWHEREWKCKSKDLAYAAYKSREYDAFRSIWHSIPWSNLERVRDLKEKSWRRIWNTPWSGVAYIQYAQTYNMLTKDPHVEKITSLFFSAISPDPTLRQTGSINQSNYPGTHYGYVKT